MKLHKRHPRTRQNFNLWGSALYLTMLNRILKTANWWIRATGYAK